MADKKTYTLELTANELRGIEKLRGRDLEASLLGKLYELEKQARADREVESLQLPWRVCEMMGHNYILPAAWGQQQGWYPIPQAAARLMSAAPELLEAVQAFVAWFDEPDDNPAGVAKIAAMFEREIELARRALRKVETGVPEC